MRNITPNPKLRNAELFHGSLIRFFLFGRTSVHLHESPTYEKSHNFSIHSFQSSVHIMGQAFSRVVGPVVAAAAFSPAFRRCVF